MIIGTCKIYLRVEWAKTLKDKRMVLRSLTDKMKNKFNISVAEVEAQDIHNLIVIGFACVTNEVSHANSIINNVVNYVDKSTDSEIIDTIIEIL